LALNASVITKVMIDIWIGIISFLLATAWTHKKRKQVNTHTNQGSLVQIPKICFRVYCTSVILSTIAFTYPSVSEGAKAVDPITSFGTEPLRTAFFTFPFFAIGLSTPFSKFRD